MKRRSRRMFTWSLQATPCPPAPASPAFRPCRLRFTTPSSPLRGSAFGNYPSASKSWHRAGFGTFSETTPRLVPTSYYVNRMLSRVSERRRHERGFSLIELLIVIAIILVILSIALPQMGKARMHSQEMAAVAEVRTINQAQVQYQSQFGQYATALTQLGPPTSAGAAEGPQAAGLIPGNLASGTASGYNFTIAQTPTGYAVTAVPKTFGSTGRRTFYSDQSAIIRENWGQEPASAQSSEIK